MLQKLKGKTYVSYRIYFPFKGEQAGKK